MVEPLKVGDVGSMIFGQPGNDTTYMLIERIEGDRAYGWDLYFRMETSGSLTPDPDRPYAMGILRKASEAELDRWGPTGWRDLVKKRASAGKSDG